VLAPHAQGTTPGIGAHVTLAIPFPPDLTPAGEEALAEIAGYAEPWPVKLPATDWFREPGHHAVLWLRPEPVQRFDELAQAIATVFDWPRYGDTGERVWVPHVTVAVGGDVDALREAEAALAPQLPLRARASELTLVRVVAGTASVVRSWALGG
jgi:2'-5' RNA ligase